MTAKLKAPKRSRLAQEMQTLAGEMHANDTMDGDAYRKITALKKAPNAETIKAMKAARRGDLIDAGSPDNLLPTLNSQK